MEKNNKIFFNSIQCNREIWLFTVDNTCDWCVILIPTFNFTRMMIDYSSPVSSCRLRHPHNKTSSQHMIDIFAEKQKLTLS